MSRAIPLEEAKRLDDRRFRLYHWSDLSAIPDRRSLVKGLLDKDAFSVVYGPSNCGKTFFALDLGLRIALGWPWRDRRAEAGGVVYVVAEGGLGVRERLTAFQEQHDLDPERTPFWVLPFALDLRRPEGDASRLIDEIRHLAEPVSLIVIDTLTRVLGGGDDSQGSDMNPFIRNCDKIRQACESHLMVIHHTGKDEQRGARGHSALVAATDTEIKVTKDDTSGISTAKVTKQRDAMGGEEFSFKLESVEIGTDGDGDVIRSCVVVPTDETPAKTTTTTTPTERNAMTALHDLLARQGRPAPPSDHIPQGVPVVNLDTWRAELKARSLLDEGNSGNQAWRRLKTNLTSKGRIGIRDDMVWAA